MENFNLEEQVSNPERHTRILTSQESLEMSRHINLLEINIPKLLENNPDLVMEIAQTANGIPLEITIRKKNVVLSYDNLEAVEGLKLQKQKPKETIH